jgi:hypothetical protein
MNIENILNFENKKIGLKTFNPEEINVLISKLHFLIENQI